MVYDSQNETLLDVVLRRFQNEEKLLVYGAGRNARIFCEGMKNSACQLVFFDHKAETEEFFFEGRRVHQPRDMLNYPCVPVLVTPSLSQDQITEQIIDLGIEQSRIYLLPQNPELSSVISMLSLEDSIGRVCHLGEPIPFSRDIFSKARRIIKDWYLTDYPVISSDGTTLFYLHADWGNRLSNGSEKGVFSVLTPNYYHGEKLNNIIDQLDLTLLSSYDGYVFEELEEYTFALTELILSLWPERPVWFRDSRAVMFWKKQQVNVLTENDGSQLPQEYNLMTIISRRTFRQRVGVRAEQRHCFDSIQIMASLCWARFIRKLGEKNPDKTVFVIDITSPMAGMGDLIKIVQAYAGLVKERGWTPVAWLHDTQYSDEPNKDLWSEWFAPLSEVSLTDAFMSTRVVLGCENGTSCSEGNMAFAWNPYLECHMIGKTLRLSDELTHRFDCSTYVKPDENSLGIVIRGTDLLPYHKSELDLKKLLWKVLTLRMEGHLGKLFLATEEEETLTAFRATWGEELLYVEQKRVRGYKTGDPLIWEWLQPPVGERMAWGEKYLYIIWCLSRCKSLVYNLGCGAVEVAIRLKEGRGEQYQMKIKI